MKNVVTVFCVVLLLLIAAVSCVDPIQVAAQTTPAQAEAPAPEQARRYMADIYLDGVFMERFSQLRQPPKVRQLRMENQEPDFTDTWRDIADAASVGQIAAKIQAVTMY